MRRHTISSALRSFVLERDGYSCVLCGATDCALQVDHNIPVSRGGTDSPANLNTLCTECHKYKGSSTLREYLNLFERAGVEVDWESARQLCVLPPFADPATIQRLEGYFTFTGKVAA